MERTEAPTKEITYIRNVCKIGQGAYCCKYIVVGGKGFECMKVSDENKEIVDEAWRTNEHVAQGDNCPGKEELWLEE